MSRFQGKRKRDSENIHVPSSNALVGNNIGELPYEQARRYKDITYVEHGAFGVTFRARDVFHGGRPVDLKRVQIQLDEGDGVLPSPADEVRALQHFHSFAHPNILKLLDTIIGVVNIRSMTMYFVFEHIERDLAHYIERSLSFEIGPHAIKDIASQLLYGLSFMHYNQIVHKDLKPCNILLTTDRRVKITDFGLSQFHPNQSTSRSAAAALCYRAPEILLCQTYESPVDIWSAGCIVAELFLRKPFFTGKDDVEQLTKIVQIIGCPREQQGWPANASMPWGAFCCYGGIAFQTIMPGICRDEADFLKQLLAFKPENRITAAESLHHAFLRGHDLPRIPPPYQY